MALSFNLYAMTSQPTQKVAHGVMIVKKSINPDFVNQFMSAYFENLKEKYKEYKTVEGDDDTQRKKYADTISSFISSIPFEVNEGCSINIKLQSQFSAPIKK